MLIRYTIWDRNIPDNSGCRSRPSWGILRLVYLPDTRRHDKGRFIFRYATWYSALLCASEPPTAASVSALQKCTRLDKCLNSFTQSTHKNYPLSQCGAVIIGNFTCLTLAKIDSKSACNSEFHEWRRGTVMLLFG